MEFKLSMLCNNAAFEGQEVREIARILRSIADRIETYGVLSEFCPIRDHNGNAVGHYGAIEEEEDA
jgi:hypothetical protein